MFSDRYLKGPDVIFDIEEEPNLVEINHKDGIYFNNKFTNEKRIRNYIYQLVIKAKEHLPDNYNFIIYEGYRPKSDQFKLWDGIVAKNKKQYPDIDINSEDFIALCDKFVANPHRQGSGHQSGAAIDISLTDDEGQEYDMGGEVRGFDNTAEFDCNDISEQAKQNRKILRKALSKVGFTNYPSEWWHYSFGDILWAKLNGVNIAIFGSIDEII